MADTAYQILRFAQSGAVLMNRPREDAEGIAAALPPLLVSAERLASSVWLGVHGRRGRHGRDLLAIPALPRRETLPPSSTGARSAKSQHLYVREREWEAAETVWLWRDGSPSMQYASLEHRHQGGARQAGSPGAGQPAGQCRRARHRAGFRGLANLGTGRHAPHRPDAVRRGAQRQTPPSLPPLLPPPAHGTVVWSSDWLDPLDSIGR